MPASLLQKQIDELKLQLEQEVSARKNEELFIQHQLALFTKLTEELLGYRDLFKVQITDIQTIIQENASRLGDQHE